MDVKKFAELITGREYRFELSKDELEIARNSNLLVIYGMSDDLLEFDGVFIDEVYAYDGIKNVLFNENGLIIKPDQEDFDEEDFENQFATYLENKKNASKVDAVWCPRDSDGNVYASWLIKTNREHEGFDIVEDGELYCKGIVIQM